MVKRISDISYRFVENSEHVELVTKNKTLRFKASTEKDQKPLSPNKTETIVTDLIKNNKIDLQRTKKEIIKLPEKEHKIAGVHSEIVLEIATVKPPSILSSVTKLFRSIVGSFFGRKSPLTRQITQEFRAIVSSFPLAMQKKIEKKLHITEEEHYLLQFFGSKIDFSKYSSTEKIEVLIEILNGGYVMIDDGGQSYDQWVQDLREKKSRVSSHESNAPQFAIRGPLLSECLFSKKIIVENGVEREVTWLQLERYPVNILYSLPHLVTWALYAVTGKNQGPLGASSHTEKSDPIILTLN